MTKRSDQYEQEIFAGGASIDRVFVLA